MQSATELRLEEPHHPSLELRSPGGDMVGRGEADIEEGQPVVEAEVEKSIAQSLPNVEVISFRSRCAPQLHSNCLGETATA